MLAVFARLFYLAGGLLIFISLAWAIAWVLLLYLPSVHRAYIEYLNGTTPTNELQDQCSTPSGEMIRWYSGINDTVDEFDSITFQPRRGKEKRFYYVENYPSVHGIQCEAKSVDVIHGDGTREIFPLTRIRDHLVHDPICYDAGYGCLSFGEVGDAVFETGCIVLSVGLIFGPLIVSVLLGILLVREGRKLRKIEKEQTIRSAPS